MDQRDFELLLAEKRIKSEIQVALEYAIKADPSYVKHLKFAYETLPIIRKSERKFIELNLVQIHGVFNRSTTIKRTNIFRTSHYLGYAELSFSTVEHKDIHSEDTVKFLELCLNNVYKEAESLDEKDLQSFSYIERIRELENKLKKMRGD